MCSPVAAVSSSAGRFVIGLAYESGLVGCDGCAGHRHSCGFCRGLRCRFYHDDHCRHHRLVGYVGILDMSMNYLKITPAETQQAERLAFSAGTSRAEGDDYYQLWLIAHGHPACRQSAERALARLRGAV